MERPGGSRFPRRINLLWVLAGLLGIAAIHTTVRAIHRPQPSAELMSHFAGVTAEYARAIAEARLQAVAREAFSPGVPGSGGASPPPGVPGAVELFHVDLTRSRVDLRTPLAAARANPLPDALLLRSAAPAAPAAPGGPDPAPASLVLHFVTDGSGGRYALVISRQRDRRGVAAGAYGLVIEARALAARLFGPGVPPDTAGDLLQRSQASLEIGTGSGSPLFTTPGPVQPYRTTIQPRGALAELAITAGLPAPPGFLLMLHSVSRQQLWLSGLLLASTALVIVIAAASTRREALLARARSDFIAGVSHELRMPLAQILLASETLAEERETDSKARLGLANSIVREARRLATLVDNVLLVARSGAVTLRPVLAVVDVDGLYAEVHDAVSLALEDAGQRLEVRARPGLRVLGDRQLLRQALTNLIDNASKYGRANQTIRLDAEANHGDRVLLTVTDQGLGVPAGLRARLLEPYERLPRDQASERTGTGLGLAVVVQIAQACGGSVRLEGSLSGEGGTRAVMVLKAAPSSAAP